MWVGMPEPYGVCNEAQYRGSGENNRQKDLTGVFMCFKFLESEHLGTPGGGGGSVCTMTLLSSQ